MKNKWLNFKKRFHKYMCTLEDRGYRDPIFIVYLLFELTRMTALVVAVYCVYRMFQIGIQWYLN